MIEKPAQPSGRTYADALVEIFSTWKLVFLVLGSLIITFYVVHTSAEPGTTVEYLGVIKYQRAKALIAPPPPLPAPKIDETATYLLPSGVKLLHYSSTAIPILDGTLAIKNDKSFLMLLGDSIAEVKIGIRNLDGTPNLWLVRNADSSGANFDTNIRLEIEFKGSYFSLETPEYDKYKSTAVFLKRIPKPTLKLRKVAELSIQQSE